jgi:SAM-dependent methyltransferase
LTFKLNEMKIFNNIMARQFRRPSGLLGYLSAGFMRKSNREYYSGVVDLLEIRDNDNILEVGFGEALAIQLIVDKNPFCHIDGIDFSRFMFRKAAKNVKSAIRRKRVRLFYGNLIDHDFGGNAYSKIFAINVIYFWKTLNEPLSRLYSLLRPGGRLVLLMSSPEYLNQNPMTATGIFNKHTIEQVQSELKRTGFGEVSYKTVSRNGQNIYYITAIKDKG